MTVYGYARVSTNGQTLATQEQALAAASVSKVFAEKVSGATGNRRALERVLGLLQPGDVLVVTKLDRLARSTRDLLNTVDRILKAGAGFKSLGDGWADTTTPHGRLMLTVLGGIAEFERELILQRTAEGRARAKAEGKKLGGPKFKLTLDQQRMAMSWIDTGLSARYVARALNINHATVCRLKARAMVARELAR